MKQQTRYEYGGDEYIFVELSEEMSLEAHYRGLAITKELKDKKLEGIVDICPGNASYMVRFVPEQIHPTELMEELKALEKNVQEVPDISIESRLVDVPILFEDPWTHEAVMRFRNNHQDPNLTDIEYAAKINGYSSKEDFIQALVKSPFMVSMLGFVPGLPFCFQMVEREKQIEVPKYVTPRTFTPERTFGFGGAFACIYPVQGAGGYQMFGMAAAPILDTKQKLYDFKESMVFPKQGDIFRFRDITLDEFEDIRSQVEKGTFTYQTKPFSYSPVDVMEEPEGFSKKVLRGLYND
ncbi:5-oxoprolinase subunit B family protein [Halalkalibacterium ligniniphilum]|uniref:5-oxoprolinase subunit B family protein n=1 Tax=Halalkalibacterium ligniniphilum TaxID=1134413 RepID=UPI00034D1810|nr:carboxyltransferase domain-containing protein [Halalkalibacterium ligniniphilum]